MKGVVVKKPGGRENLEVRNDLRKPVLDHEDFVIVRVYSTALNRADISQREGMLFYDGNNQDHIHHLLAKVIYLDWK